MIPPAPPPVYRGPTLSQALRALNDAAYAAAKAARHEQSPLGLELRTMALRTDEMVDASAPQPAMQEAAE